MAQPIYRLSISNKDKTLRTYTDYKGNQKESKYQSFGAIFEQDDGRLSCAIDKKVTIDPEKVWVNVYVVEKKDGDDEETPKSNKASKPATKKVTKKAPPPDDEDDEPDPFADSDN